MKTATAASRGIGPFALICYLSLSHQASNPDYHMSAKQPPKIWGKGWLLVQSIERSQTNHLLLSK